MILVLKKNNNKKTLRKNSAASLWTPPHTRAFLVLFSPNTTLSLVRQGQGSRSGQCPVVPTVPLGSHLSAPARVDTRAPGPAQATASAAASAQSCSSLCPPSVRSPLSFSSGLLVPFLKYVFTGAHLVGTEAPQTPLVGAAVPCSGGLGAGWIRLNRLCPAQPLVSSKDATPAAPHPTRPCQNLQIIPSTIIYVLYSVYFIYMCRGQKLVTLSENERMNKLKIAAVLLN